MSFTRQRCVTGGAYGIGRAIAQRLRRDGAHAVTAQRGGDVEFDSLALDLADPATPALAVERTTWDSQPLAIHKLYRILQKKCGFGIDLQTVYTVYTVSSYLFEQHDEALGKG